jgi:hypothetical protein
LEGVEAADAAGVLCCADAPRFEFWVGVGADFLGVGFSTDGAVFELPDFGLVTTALDATAFATAGF